MKTLKRSELIEGKIYQCALSGKYMLITLRVDKEQKMRNGEVLKWTEVSGVYFSDSYYRPDVIRDGQLMELKDEF